MWAFCARTPRDSPVNAPHEGGVVVPAAGGAAGRTVSVWPETVGGCRARCMRKDWRTTLTVVAQRERRQRPCALLAAMVAAGHVIGHVIGHEVASLFWLVEG